MIGRNTVVQFDGKAFNVNNYMVDMNLNIIRNKVF